ncbi:hypothetical protein [Olivibacter sitiensis]|uniref:hypothetical protein n=1 Tax=Olivibacter sitiensis TaxID=376470 RepID=UPI0006857E9A|nr:hypothetical protein [Olivibacter sitiensis]
MKRLFKSRVRFVAIPLLALACVGLVSFVVMQLWNYVVPSISGLSSITFWQAMALFLLCKLLFGFGGGKKGGGPWTRRAGWKRFDQMNEKEQEGFKASMRYRMCHWDKETPIQNEDKA